MSDAEDRLHAVFALDTPPARDAAFVFETTRRIQKHRFWIELLTGIPWVIAASAILWAAKPWLETVGRPAISFLAALAPAGAVVVGAMFLGAPRSGTV